MTFSKTHFPVLLILFALPSFGQEDPNTVEIYGYIMTDGGYNFNSSDPDWFDVMRPTKLPKHKNEFGPSGNFFFSVRQTRFGIRSSTNTSLGKLKTQFDFDLFGFGKDAGQTTFHLVNAFGELGKFLAGQTPSTIMDTDVFPITLDYWGPCSRIFLLNVQIRYTPIYTERERLAIALERPGATADGTDYSGSVDIQHVRPRFPLPNLTAHYRRSWPGAYVRVAGILKYLSWKDMTDTTYNLTGTDLGWGINVSTVINVSSKLKFKVQGEFGEGFQNHIADPSPDVALERSAGDPLTPAKGKALPVWGFFSFAEIKWNSKLETTLGFSKMKISNTDLQSPDAFRSGQYGLINFRYYPSKNVMTGIEYQYGRRNNFSDGFQAAGNKVQVSFKYYFSTISTATER